MDIFSYDTIATFVVVFLGACAAIALIANALKVIKEWMQPGKDIAKIVAEHERKLANDDLRLKDLQQSSNLQIQALLQIANHMIEGNHTDQLKAVRDEMQQFLVTR